MDQVKKIKDICKEKGVSVAELEKACDFSNGYIGSLKKGVLPSDRLFKICDYLDVNIYELLDVDYAIDYKDAPLCLEVRKALNGPQAERLLLYAKKLNELSELENFQKKKEV